MRGRRVFFDTNILVYAHDADAEEKHHAARKAVMDAWENTVSPVISVQVLQEFFVNLRKKLEDFSSAVDIVDDYAVWPVVVNDLTLFRAGVDLVRSSQVSLWDAMIIAAAQRANVDEIWSEDLNTGQRFGSVTIVNPLTP